MAENMIDEFEYKGRKRQTLEEEKDDEKDILKYNAPAQVRHLTFVCKNGESHSYYYHDLRKLAFMPENQKLVLTITSDTVTLQGRNLQALRDAMRNYLVQEVRTTDVRYAGTKADNEIVVTEINVAANNS